MSDNETGISRVIRSKEEAKASYDRMSKWYDILAGRFERKYRDAGLRKLDAREGEIVLEIGFATGNCILSLAQSVGETGRVYGIDISEGMCNIAQARVKKASLSEMVKLQCSDAAQLPFEADFFDAIFMSFTLELFDTPEIPAVINECRRVLRNDGRVCIVAMTKKGQGGMMVRLYEWFHRKFPKYIDCRPIFARKELEKTGFRIHDVTEMSMWGLPVEIVLAKKWGALVP
jgi:demethylmenaquinone methyltransferase/2-methoxy-6-polyprenyl-1,4-benzoquinol methylase